MSAPFWVQELASDFWQLAGDETYPRTLRGPIARAMPLSVVSVSGLSVAEVDRWLMRQKVVCALRVPNRPLRACLVAYFGVGLIFLDGTDPEEEQRFSLAHELAHFLRDYWQPRRRAAERLGPEILEVFDGRRPAHIDERLHALLARVPVGIHVHLMDRSRTGWGDDAVHRAERHADRLAFELLAPAEDVGCRLAGMPPQNRRSAGTQLLQETYGLPPRQAADYAALLSAAVAPRSSFAARLRVARPERAEL